MITIEPLLKDIGMKEYEAKAFTTVVQSGVCSAEQISKRSRIPLTRVYETMASLQKRGLVTVMNTRPKMYRLVSVDALSNIIEEKKRLLQQEIDRSATIIKQIKQSMPRGTASSSQNEVKGDFWIFKGRETAIRKITEEEKKSGREILLFSDDFSWFPRFKKVLGCRTGSGVTVKILINLNEMTTETVKELLDIGVEVRGWEGKGLRGDIIDGRMAHLVSKIPRAGVSIEDNYGEPGNDELFMYDCLATDNPIIVNMIKTYFDIFWWRGERPQGLIMARQGKRFK
jgi:sugar-specific transcriptional regulator TrmB